VRNLLVTLGLVVAVCAGAFGAFFAANREPADLRRAALENNAMEWLRSDFHPNPAQFAAIRALHADFARECSVHCAAITAARRRHDTPAAIAKLEDFCVRAMTEHFHRVAALMPPGEGRRYLAVVLPRIADYGHGGAPDLRMRP
jgi:hypothetical protein